MEHTKEPWITKANEVDEHCFEVMSDGWYVATTHDGCDGEQNAEANARRIVACVNALAGVPTEWLEGFTLSNIDNVVQENAGLKQQRDELLAACNTFHEWLTREEAGFCKAGRDRSTPEGEAAWREWYDENLRLCSLAHEQVRAAIARAQGK